MPASIVTVEKTVEDREERIYCGVKFPSNMLIPVVKTLISL